MLPSCRDVNINKQHSLIIVIIIATYYYQLAGNLGKQHQHQQQQLTCLYIGNHLFIGLATNNKYEPINRQFARDSSSFSQCHLTVEL